MAGYTYRGIKILHENGVWRIETEGKRLLCSTKEMAESAVDTLLGVQQEETDTRIWVPVDKKQCPN